MPSNDVAVHITLRRLIRPADNRIRDVRVVRDSHAESAEARLWEIQD